MTLLNKKWNALRERDRFFAEACAASAVAAAAADVQDAVEDRVEQELLLKAGEFSFLEFNRMLRADPEARQASAAYEAAHEAAAVKEAAYRAADAACGGRAPRRQ